MKRWATVARVGSVGDNLMAASVLPLLRRQGYSIEVISATPCHVVFLHNPHVDKLSVIDVNKDLDNTKPVPWQLWWHRRSLQSDVFVHLSHSCELKHCLLPEQSWFWWPPEMRRKICAGNYLETVHDIAQVPYEFGPLFFENDTEHELAVETKRQAGGKYVIGWVLTGSRIDRRFPNTALAIARLIKELDASVIITGEPSIDTFNDAKAIMAQVMKQNGSDKGFVFAISPDNSLTWGLRRSLVQLLHCDLVISPDTGPPWAVAFEQVPKIMMVSNSSAENVTKHWRNTITLQADRQRVPCFPCHRLHEDKSTCVSNAEDTGAKCISDISVECLVRAAQAALGDAKALTEFVREFRSNIGDISGASDQFRVQGPDHSGSDHSVRPVRDDHGRYHLDTGFSADHQWDLDGTVYATPPSPVDGRIRLVSSTSKRAVLEVIHGGTALADEVVRRINGGQNAQAS